MLKHLELYKETMTGKDIVISIIDTGVNIKSEAIEHYYCTEEEVVKNNDYHIIDNHGTLCAKQIIEIAKNSKIIDINVSNSYNKITEDKIIKAIKFSIERKVDIINISLKLDKYSNNLYEICKRAAESNIIIIAATDKELSFPADFESVIKISIDDQQDDDIKIINKNHISIKNFVYQFEINNKQYIVPNSSSIGCAYFSGIMALFLEANPFLSKREILDKLFINCKDENLHINSNTKIIQDGTAIIVTPDHSMEIFEYTELINNGIVGSYDFILKKFRNFNNNIIEDNKISSIIEINSTEREKVLIPVPEALSEKPLKYVGNFLKAESYDEINLCDHYITQTTYINTVNAPIILIASFGYGSSKFNLQVELFRRFKEKSIKTSCITYNPLGVIFDFIVYKYPKQVIFPDIVYSINRDLSLIEKHIDIDLFIVNIAGSITPLNQYNINKFGTLFDAYVKAVNADILLLCINQGIRMEAIANELERIKLLGIPEVILVISRNRYDDTSFDSSTGIKYILSDEIERQKFYDGLKKQFTNNRVFTCDNKNNELSDTILQLLT